MTVDRPNRRRHYKRRPGRPPLYDSSAAIDDWSKEDAMRYFTHRWAPIPRSSRWRSLPAVPWQPAPGDRPIELAGELTLSQVESGARHRCWRADECLEYVLERGWRGWACPTPCLSRRD